MINKPGNKSSQIPSNQGWSYCALQGTNFEIGCRHGEALKDEIQKAISTVKDYTYWATGIQWNNIREQIWDLWWTSIPSQYQHEINGIAIGARTNIKDIFLWNAYMEVLYYTLPTHINQFVITQTEKRTSKSPDSCSAFIAVGDYTEDNGIVMAHNSFTGFELAYMNVILDITTDQGARFIMQAAPGWITSNTDFGINRHGILITETTIGGFNNYCDDYTKLQTLMPEFIRARMAMEYSSNLDDFVTLMLDKNNGGYANSWLVGDTVSNEIMKFELGYSYHNIEKSTNGYFAGFNAAIDPRIRNLECSNSGYMDIRRHQGARQVRIPQLLEQNKGKITPETAKTILADHYDPYLSQLNGKDIENVCSRNIDAHYELDPREYMSQSGRPLPFQPQGAVDGKIVDTTLANNMQFLAKWGSSSRISFDADDFFKKHPQFNDMKPYIASRPYKDWITTNNLTEQLINQ